MATSQSTSPVRSSQAEVLFEQHIRLSTEAPQLLAALEVLLPLAKAELRKAHTTRPPGEADAWALGIALAEDALERVKPYGHVLLKYLLSLEAIPGGTTTR